MSDTIRVMITEEEVEEKIRSLGEQISRDYEGKSVMLIGILKGASFFMCELAKRITVPVFIDFMSVSSYGNSSKSSGVVRINMDINEPVEGKDIIIVEDLVDTGRTLNYLMELMRGRGANSIKIATLLDKPDRRVVDLIPDYAGFSIPNEFVVGWGMDYAQKYRNLPYVGVVELEAKDK